MRVRSSYSGKDLDGPADPVTSAQFRSKLHCSDELAGYPSSRLSSTSECTCLAMHIKLGLQRRFVLLAVWAMTSALRLEGHGRTMAAVGLDRNVAQPFRNPQSRLLHS